jgi:hypothetical protein
VLGYGRGIKLAGIGGATFADWSIETGVLATMTIMALIASS